MMTLALLPLVRDRKRDFASVSGTTLLQAKVIQALATEGSTALSSGELPWRTQFGSGLAALRHQRNTPAVKTIAEVYVREALQRWVPEVTVTDIEVCQQENAVDITVRLAGTSPVSVVLALEFL